MKILKFIRNIFFPPGCVLCDYTMEPNTTSDFCGKCADKVSFCSDGWCCEKCGKPIVSFGEKQLCYFCVNKNSKYFDRIVSVFEYSGIVKHSILRYKGMEIRAYAGAYAKIMTARFYEEYGDINFDFICAVPSYRKNSRDKKFDHIGEICKYFSEYTGIEYLKNTLVKIRQTEKQRSLNYEKRMTNLIDSMVVGKAADVKDKTVLLIDDVCTTRATVMECAKILKRGGAKKVYVLTLATTTKED